MIEAAVERRLAAILAADVVGYSRLIGVDEAGTLSALRALRKDLVEPTLKRHHGRIVKLMGDGILVEFASVVDAVAAAVEIQEVAPQRSAHLPEDRRIELRIGVNSGDVVVEDGDLFGDGVNIAARLQEIADPNGVMISEGVHRELSGRLDLPFKDFGEKTLKNIKQPMQTWMWTPKNTFDSAPAPNAPLELSDKPSIAVLPFDNLSKDPDQEFLADGMTEDIITGLSRFRSLFVIARNSTFAYKGMSPDVREVARELGVRYILEGSVRQGGARIRITGQLIDAATGGHIWAERYDRDLDDIFLIQDEVTEAIVAAIAPEIDEVERGRAHRKPPGNLDSWNLFQRALASYYATTEESIGNAITAFDEINRRDRQFAPAFALAADARIRLFLHYKFGNDALLTEALEKARLGGTLDKRDSTCLWAEGRAHSLMGNHATAITKGQEAVNLNPSSAMAHYILGFILGRAGRHEEAIPHLENAVRLSPRDIFIAGFLSFGSVIQFYAGRYEVALEWAQRGSESPNPRRQRFQILVATLVRLDRLDEARAALVTLLEHEQGSNLGEIRRHHNRVFPMSVDGNALFLEALREAGLPE